MNFMYELGDNLVLLDGAKIEEGYGHGRVNPTFTNAMKQYIGSLVTVIDRQGSYTPRIPLYMIETHDRHRFWVMEDWIVPQYSQHTEEIDAFYDDFFKDCAL